MNAPVDGLAGSSGRSSHGSASGQKPDFRGDFLKRLRDPVQLRVLVTALAVGLGYLAIYTPLSASIENAARRQALEQRRLEQAHAVGQIRAQCKRFKDRFPSGTDPNEYVEYLLGGIRRFPLKLVTLEAEPPQSLGPYRVVTLRISLEGSFLELNRFLRWLDSNERLLRVDTIKLDPDPKKNFLMLHLTVRGMMV